MSRRRICAVPGCTSETGAHWKALCRPCFRALPSDLREEITRVRRYSDLPKNERDRRYRKAQREAETFMAQRRAEQAQAPTETFARTERLLGERS